MAVRTVFATESGNQPASQLDNMFADVWQGATMSCTCAGTNSITLTPRVSNPYVFVPTAYTPGQRFSFDAAATSTGLVTVQVGGLMPLNLYLPGPVQAGAGNVVISTYYEIAFDPTLNSGNGGFMVVNATTQATAQPIQGALKNLLIQPSSNTLVTLSADQVVVWNASNGAFTVISLNTTINTALGNVTSTANGMDGETVAVNTFYHVWAIYNPTTATSAGLLSSSSTAPTLPSGYSYKARVGAVLSDGSSNLLRTIQKGRLAQYVIGTNPTVPPVIANGIAGTYSVTSPTLASVTVAAASGANAFVPPTANRIILMGTNKWKSGTLAGVLAAPNTSWGGTNNGPAASNGVVWPFYIDSASNPGIGNVVSMVLESTAIAWASTAAGGALACLGWEDNI